MRRFLLCTALAAVLSVGGHAAAVADETVYDDLDAVVIEAAEPGKGQNETNKYITNF